MPFRFRALARPRSAAAVIAVLIGALLIGQAGVVVARARKAPPASQAPVVDPSLIKVLPSDLPDAEPPAVQTSDPPDAPEDPAPERGPLYAFGGLGAWVDVYDFDDLDMRAALEVMRENGVRTLYVQTGRYNTRHDVAPAAGAWLVAAHEVGIDVVGWYLPSYRRLGHDVKRTVAIADYEIAGQRFDGLGIDIEFKGEVRHVPTWNDRVAKHAEKVRARLGDYPIAAITPPPLQMDVAPWMWAGFPWRRLARASDLIMLMNYWSFRDCGRIRAHCAGPFTARNVRTTRLLAGDPDIPVHVIGGVGDAITPRELKNFADAAVRTDAFGASLYDYLTTRTTFWAPLRRLADL